MKISNIRMLLGPNLWGRHTALQAIVACEPDECSIDALPQFEARLRERFPQVRLMRQGRKDREIGLAHVLELATLALQAEAGCPVTFSRTVQTFETGVFQVVVEYSEEAVARLAFDQACALTEAARTDTAFDLAACLRSLSELDADIRLGPSTGSIVNAALKRNIPVKRMTEGSMVQLGWGSRQKRIWAAETSNTSAIAESIAQDKELTKRLLHAAGISVPAGVVVDNADAAWEAARALGGPTVLKPRDGNQGKGVTVLVQTEAQVRTAFDKASQYDSKVIVERFIAGQDYRFLVVGKRMIAAARREPAQVTGDGLHTILELVEIENRDPRRGDGHATSLTKIPVDDIAVATLAKRGLTTASVLDKGARVFLRNNANLSTGGTATDVSDDVHPELAASVVAAARMVGLDICGIDVVCETVLKPLEEQGGAILEVNAAPGLRMHLSPSYGKGRQVGEAIIDMMFPPGEDGRIPVVAVTGTNGKTTTVRMTAHLLESTGLRVGMTTTDGVYVSGDRIDTGDCSGPRSARNVLAHPDVDAAVFETARGGILREGLGFDRCKVAVVTNIGQGDHLGLGFITSVEDLSVLKWVVVQSLPVDGTAVLNAADPIVARLGSSCPAEVIYFAQNALNPVISVHRAQGRRALFIEDGDMVGARGKNVLWRVPLTAIPLTAGGTFGFQIDNAMAAAGAAWACGLEPEQLAAGLASFVSDAQTAPGRFNQFSYRGATLIADYGHNPDAMRALAQAVQAMPGKRRHVVISGAGDRRDEDIREQTRILGDTFDNVILYQDQCQRGRADGEVLALLREGLVGTRRATSVCEVRGEFLAIDTALEALESGDVCLILVDQVEESLDYIHSRVQARAGTPSAALAG